MSINNRILQLCKEKKISVRKLSKLTDIPYVTLKNVVYKKANNIGLMKIQKICIALEITEDEFFDFI